MYRWIPDTGGSNIPALNDLLRDFGIELGDKILEGYFSMLDHRMYYASGTSFLQFPQNNNSILIERELHDQGKEVLQGTSESSKKKRWYPILGLLQTDQSFIKIQPATPNPPKQMGHSLEKIDDSDNEESRVQKRILLRDISNNEIEDYEQAQSEKEDEQDMDSLNSKLLELDRTILAHTKKIEKSIAARFKSGRLAIYGDSNCLDSTHLDKACFWLLDSLLEYTMSSHLTSLLKNMNRSGKIKFDTGKKKKPSK